MHGCYRRINHALTASPLDLVPRQGIPRVLLTDPWPDTREAQLRRDHAALIVRRLREWAPDRFTAQQVFDRINAAIPPSASSSPQGTVGEGESPRGDEERGGSGAPRAAVFGSVGYVRQLLEHLRTSRMVRGANNPQEADIGPGTRHYPMLYYAMKYQQVREGL